MACGGKADPDSVAGVGGHLPTHFFDSVKVNAARISRNMGSIANGIIQNLAKLPDTEVDVTVEIQARVPGNVVCTVSENCRTLKFTSQGFARE